MRSGRAGDIHVESQCVLVEEVAADGKRAGVDSQRITAFVEQVGGKDTAADISSGFARAELLKFFRFIGIERGQYIIAAHGAEIKANAQAGGRRAELVFKFNGS